MALTRPSSELQDGKCNNQQGERKGRDLSTDGVVGFFSPPEPSASANSPSCFSSFFSLFVFVFL